MVPWYRLCRESDTREKGELGTQSSASYLKTSQLYDGLTFGSRHTDKTWVARGRFRSTYDS
jgi:hypothetical protein